MLIKPDVQRFAKIRTFSLAVSNDFTARFEEPCLFVSQKGKSRLGGNVHVN